MVSINLEVLPLYRQKATVRIVLKRNYFSIGLRLLRKRTSLQSASFVNEGWLYPNQIIQVLHNQILQMFQL